MSRRRGVLDNMMRYVRQGDRWWRGGFLTPKIIRELDQCKKVRMK